MVRCFVLLAMVCCCRLVLMSVVCVGVVNNMFDCLWFGVMVFVCVLVLAAIVRRRAPLSWFVRCRRSSSSFVVGCCLLLLVFVMWCSLLLVVVLWCLLLLLVVVVVWSGVGVNCWSCALLVVCCLSLVGIVCCCVLLRDVCC